MFALLGINGKSLAWSVLVFLVAMLMVLAASLLAGTIAGTVTHMFLGAEAAAAVIKVAMSLTTLVVSGLMLALWAWLGCGRHNQPLGQAV